MSNSTLLPDEFSLLEPFAADWVIAQESDRIKKRLGGKIQELEAFYEAAFPQLDAMLVYLNQFPVDALPPKARNLLYLCFSLAEIACPVEAYHEPAVTEGFDARRFVICGEKNHNGYFTNFGAPDAAESAAKTA